MILDVSDSTIDGILTYPGLVIVDFWYEGCPPCRMLTPILQNLDNKNNNIVIAKLNTRENPISAQHYKISSVPTLLFIKNGVIQKKLVGLQNENSLQKIVDSLNS